MTLANRLRCATALTAIVAAITLGRPVAGSQSPDGVTDAILTFTGADGTALEGKLSVPASSRGPVPVVFYLHGAGPRTFDHAVRYRDAAGEIRQTRYYDYYARELAREGIAFFRVSKRGCSVGPDGRPVVDRAVFSKATSTVLLQDYAAALDALRRRPDVDARRIVLMGSSEGTRLAPQLARRSPAGVLGLVLMSYQPDNIRDTVVWQNTVGPWRAVTSLIPEAADEALTKSEYDAALKRDATLAVRLPFAQIDQDKNEIATSAELAALVKPRLDAILKAVEERNDDLLWQAVLNLSSAYLLDGWNGPPTQAFLLDLEVPIGIFHGDLDGTTRVEGVHETETAFAARGKRTLTVRTYRGLDHDLGWTPAVSGGRGPQPFQEAFRFAADVARR
jgi:dienelactone hydrolase